jgi:hypothetical protein
MACRRKIDDAETAMAQKNFLLSTPATGIIRTAVADACIHRMDVLLLITQVGA